MSKAILGTTTDARENITSGILGMGETLLDALMWMGNAAAKGQYYQNGGGYNVQADQIFEQSHAAATKGVEEFIKKDLYDEGEIAKTIISAPVKSIYGVDAETDSVFAEKTDALMQSAGQLTAQMGLQAVGIPWFVTSGLTSFGGEAENALKAGASYEEAGLSAAITAGAEILTEKISGGIKFGGNTLDDVLTKKLAREVSSKFLRNALKFGLDFAGEGLEEVMSENLSRFGQWLTYQDEESLVQMLWSEEAMDAKIQAFLSGGLLGGGSSAVNAVKSAASGVDAVSGLTQNEQKVVDKVYKDAIEGKDLSQKEKTEIYDEILEQMEKGYLSTDTIEEILGGESYKTYKNAMDSQKALRDQRKALQEEFKTLNQMKHGDMTGEQTDRRTELKEKLLPQIQQKIAEGEKNTSRDQLSREVSDLVKDSRLAESYAERGRRGEAFQADVSQYAENQRATVQAAIDSGVLNNTNRSHELVDFVAKLSADKGVAFDFTNNEKLKESGFALEGVTVNGFVSDSGVTVNVQSAKALNAVVGHEITHVLEGTQLYDALAQSITEYAKGKGDYKTRLAQLTKLYEGKEGYEGADAAAKIEREVVADLVGDYLFTDKAFVQKLSTEHRNVFQKIWDEVKYLCKVVTAGSKEAKQLLEVKKIFEEAYKAQKNTADGGVKYHVSEDLSAEIDKALKNELNKSSQVKARDFTPEILVTNGVKDLPMLITQKHVKTTIYTEAEAKELGLPTGKNINYHGLGKDLLMKSIDNMDNPAAVYKKDSDHYLVITEMRDSSGRNIMIPVKIDGKGTYNDVYIDENQILSAYGRNNLQGYLENNQFELIYKKEGTALNEGVQYSNISDSSADNVAQNPENVKYSLSDADGKELTKEQAEYFQGSKVRDENGTIWEATLNVANSTNGEKILYDISPIKKVGRSGKSDTLPTDGSVAQDGGGVNNKNSLSENGQADDIAPLPWQIKGEDVALEFPLPPGYQEQGSAANADELRPVREDAVATPREYISLEDYANNESPVWRNVGYADEGTKATITQETHDRMVSSGAVVTVAEDVMGEVEKSFPDLRSMKKTERTPILKEAINKLKSNIRQFLTGLSNQSFEFEVNGKVLEAKLYSTGINEVLEKVTQEKANMLYSTEEIFRNAQYLYSTPDYDGDPNVYRWNYFYTPVQIGEETVGVRIAVRDVVKGVGMTPESQIYNWGIKKDASLDGGRRGPRVASSGVSSDASSNNIPQTHPNVNPEASTGAAPSGKERKWVGTSTGSEAVDGKILPSDLDQELTYYQPISNKKTLGNANARLDKLGYDKAVDYFRNKVAADDVKLDDIALGERLIQEAVKKGDYETASDLIMDISIIGTELGQKVQALSIIKRLTPEGQLKMLQKMVERGKAKGDKAYEGVEITSEMRAEILSASNGDGTYDQKKLNAAVESVKQQIADQMPVTFMEKVNAWRYLSMLGNPKTHIRNIVSNIAMMGARSVKNAIARTIEDIAPMQTRTKTWKRASEEVKTFAKQAAIEAYKGEGNSKYSDSGSIKAKRQIFQNKVLNAAENANSTSLSLEDTVFSKHAYRTSLQEYLTANGITTQADIEGNPKLVAEAKAYAMEQAKEATFQQDSYIASKISQIEQKNALFGAMIGSTIPFKKTPVNVAKTAVAYSPLGFARNIYDAVQVKKGNMDASEAIDHLAQTLTGTSLSLIGYALASMGIFNGAGEDDKEGKFDYQLGEQSYSITIGDSTYSLSWLSPVAMPLFVGVNAYEQLVEGKEWNADMVFEALGKTLDPMSEMSFLSSLDDVLSSYESGAQRFLGIFESMGQNYISQMIPTLSSQIAATFDDTKRTTKASADSDFTFGEETVRSLMYKIPGLRNVLEPSTDIWGNEVKQADNVLTRALESFLAPYSRREDISADVDTEIRELYSQVGDSSLIPSAPYSYINYSGEKYEMSAEEFTSYKQTYGQTAYDLMEKLFATNTYRNADDETKADMIGRVYDHARDVAKQELLQGRGVTYTNTTQDGKKVYNTDPIVGAIENDMSVDEYKYSVEYPKKYQIARAVGGYESYMGYRDALGDIKSDKDEDGNTISGSRKQKVVDYINGLDAAYGEKIILYVSAYPSKESRSTYGAEIVDYLSGREDLSYQDVVTILTELGFTVRDGWVTWD